MAGEASGPTSCKVSGEGDAETWRAGERLPGLGPGLGLLACGAARSWLWLKLFGPWLRKIKSSCRR